MADESQSVPDIINQIHTAWRRGRPIVPFLGAGISAQSGFPLTDALRAYLLRTKFYIQEGVFRHTLGQPKEDLVRGKSRRPDDPENSPARYISRFGWPDFNRLNFDLYQYSRPGDLGTGSSRREWIDRTCPCPSEDDDGNGEKKLDPDLLRELRKSPAYTTIWSKYWAETTKNTRWGRDRWRLQTLQNQIFLKDLILRDENHAVEIMKQLWAVNLRPKADWASLLLSLAEGDLGLIDGLIARLSMRYQPGSSHVLLAHLVRLLGVKVVLTINFDPFIEEAFSREGLKLRVFDVGRDALFPSPSVVGAALSVLKLHGSGHSAKWGEPLDYSLDETARSYADQYIPPNALLLVMGFSGNERHMMQLLEHLSLRQPRPNADSCQATETIWLHCEDKGKLPATVGQFRVKTGDRMQTARISDAGDFLLELYQVMTATLPRSIERYSAMPKRILDLAKDIESKTGDLPRDEIKGHAVLFARSSLLSAGMHPPARVEGASVVAETPPAPGDTAPSQQSATVILERMDAFPSIKMSEFVHSLTDYNCIWIDLEDHHTLAGVVNDVINKMRVFDPGLPPLLLPDDLDVASAENFNTACNQVLKPVRFIHRALHRGRYVLAFDSLEGFGREQTQHHGLPAHEKHVTNGAETSEISPFEKVLSRVIVLRAFLQCLVGLVEESAQKRIPIGPKWLDAAKCDWYCCVTCDEPSGRHLNPQVPADALRLAVRKQIAELCNEWDKRSRASVIDDPEDGFTIIQSQPPSPAYVAGYPDSLLKRLELCKGDDRQLQRSLADFTSHIQQPIVREIHEFLVDVARREDPPASGADAADAHDNIPPSWLPQDQTTPLLDSSIPYLVCSMFRRPRSRSSLLRVMGDYVGKTVSLGNVRRWVERSMALLAARNLVKPMPGGYYWLAHHAHEWTYKILTEPLRLRTWDENLTALANSADPGESAKPIVERLTFLIMLHSRIARHYYLHTYLRSKDYTVLFEYFYHRVSSLRYAKHLSALLGWLDEKQIRSPRILENAETPFGFAIRALESKEKLEAFDAARVDSERAVVDYVRQKLLNNYMNVLRRESETILSTGSADTWLSWIEQLIHDQPFLVDLPALKPKLTGRAPQDLLVKYWGDQTHPVLEQNGHDLLWNLRELAGRLLREKRAYNRCRDARLESLTSLCRETADELSKTEALKEADSRATISSLLANIERPGNPPSYIRWWHDVTQLLAVPLPFPRDKPPTVLEWLLTESGPEESVCDVAATVFTSLLDIAACERHLRKGPIGLPDVPADQKDLTITEWLHKRTEVLLGEIEAVFFDRKKMVSQRAWQRIRGFRRDLEFDSCRFQLEGRDPWRKGANPVFTKQAEELLTEIESYRHCARGAPGADLDEFFRRQCQFRTLSAKCLNYLGRYEDAYHTLSQAGNGLRLEMPQHRFLLANVQIERADGKMLSANDSVAEPFNNEVSAIVECQHEKKQHEPREKHWFIKWSRARRQLSDAAASLAEAQQLLSTTRRGVGRWRHLYEKQIQLRHEELLLMLFRLGYTNEPVNDGLDFVSQVYASVSPGLEAVRAAWDCRLEQWRDEASLDQKWREATVRRWLQLMTATFAILNQGVLLVGADQKQSSDASEYSNLWQAEWHRGLTRQTFGSHEIFCERWTNLNASAGLNGFAVQEVWPVYLSKLEHWLARRWGHVPKCSPRKLVLDFEEKFIWPGESGIDVDGNLASVTKDMVDKLERLELKEDLDSRKSNGTLATAAL